MVKIYIFFQICHFVMTELCKKDFQLPNIFWDNEFQKNYFVVCLQL